ncbi:hypothetical protein [Streptomyces sp. NPDC006784]|uniref:hypothetical protein n=1 Tax=Streptomyces sp. NPDC006784 TaxID=3364764 RepID=UPI003677D527
MGSRYGVVPRPTERAALAAVARTARPLPPVPALMAALLEANERRDRAGVCLCAHAVVRAAQGQDGGRG